MTPHDRRALRARQQKLDRAIELLKRQPGFPAAQVQILEVSQAAVAGLTETEKQFGTASRLASVLQLLDVRARGYLALVSSMESQEAFMVMLDELRRQAWKEYTRFHIEMLQPTAGDPQYASIQHRVSDWIGEGYKRLVPAVESSPQDARSLSFERTLMAPPAPPLHTKFIAPTRIDELRACAPANLDFRKLVRLCEEINICAEEKCWYAVAMLIRATLDHVPPVFNAAKFEHVVANYGGGRSFKDTMEHLQEASRKIADAHLHERMRASEVLPTPQQVNCGQQLDMLLAEIVRITPRVSASNP